MGIKTSQVVKGAYYETPTGQLRRIDKLSTDKNKRRRVHYSAKSIKLKNLPFVPQATKANPALDTTFARKCERRLSATEETNLRKKGVILQNE